MNKYINKSFEKDPDHRFTTDEMEKSQTRCGCDFKITSLLFEDKQPQFPTKAVGCINTCQGWKINASWNQHGECSVGNARIEPFDLIKFNDQKVDELKPFTFGFEHAVL